MEKLTKQEKLYDITQMAKAIFVQKAKGYYFGHMDKITIDEMIKDCFVQAEHFIEEQEKYALQGK